MSGQPWRCGGVDWPRTARNHSRTGGKNRSSGSEESIPFIVPDLVMRRTLIRSPAFVRDLGNWLKPQESESRKHEKTKPRRRLSVVLFCLGFFVFSSFV